MRYNIKVTNKETKTVWFHDGMTRDDLSWIRVDPNLVVEICSEYREPENREPYTGYRNQYRDQQEN